MESFCDLSSDIDSSSQVSSENNNKFHSISYHDIAGKLLGDNFLLTALELHSELIENGRELPKLRDFFSNPGNFEFQRRNDLSLSIPRSSSQVTLDSLDFARLSEDGERTTDDRIAVLEFELRKANEKINSLRANLTVVTDCSTPTTDGSDRNSAYNEPIKPHELRALNFLINEYLLEQGYKLTSITFADQNDNQDFEDWDDVGLNMAKPMGLVGLYRAGLKNVTSNEATDIGCQTEDLPLDEESLDKLIEERNQLRDELMTSQKEKLQLVIDCERDERRNDVALVDVSVQTADTKPEKLVTSERTTQTEIDSPVIYLTPEAVKEIEEAVNNLKSTPIVSGFEREIAKEVNLVQDWDGLNNITNKMLTQTLCPTMLTVCQSLPFNSRQIFKDVVHLLVYLILLNPDPNSRDNLMQCLLNLKKKPTDDDRNILISGLVRLARMQTSEELIEAHLLPQCWELMSNKYWEKRILVIEICANISLYIKDDLRNSLLLSILQQLVLEDKEEGVRVAAVKALSLITTFMQESEKYQKVEQLMLKTLSDPSEKVIQIALKTFLPVSARFALQSSNFHEHLMPKILDLVKQQIQDNKQLNSGMRALVCLLPHLVIFVASAPDVTNHFSQDLPPAQSRSAFASLCQGLFNPVMFYTPKSEKTVGSVMKAFDHCVKNNINWEQLDWLKNKILPEVFTLVDLLSPSQAEMTLHFVKFFKNLCSGFGSHFTQTCIKDTFLKRMDSLQTDLESSSSPNVSVSSIPVFILGILAPLQVSTGEEVGENLERFFICLSLHDYDIEVLKITFREACKSTDLLEPVMASIWKGVVHSSSKVKCCSSALLCEVVPHCSDQLIANRVLPGLITLASDSDLSVRVSTVPVFAHILQSSKNKDVISKIYLQLQSIIIDPALIGSPSCLVKMISQLDKLASHSEAQFREEVLLAGLGNFVALAGQVSPEADQLAVIEALVEVYSNTIYCQISPQTIEQIILPPLRHLVTICRDVLPSHLETVTQMEREIESRVNPSSSMARSSSNISLGLSSANIKDMKQQVSRIFSISSPISKSTNIPNVQQFFKKKT